MPAAGKKRKGVEKLISAVVGKADVFDAVIDHDNVVVWFELA